MRSFNFLICFIVFFHFKVFGQKIDNVKATQKGDSIIISYDLLSNENETYTIKLFSSSDNGVTFDNSLQFVSGDINNGISSGLNKKIFWSLSEELEAFDGYLVFKVQGEKENKSLLKEEYDHGFIQIDSLFILENVLKLNFTFLYDDPNKTVGIISLKTANLYSGEGKNYNLVEAKLGKLDFMKNVTCFKGVKQKGTLLFNVPQNQGQVEHLLALAVSLNIQYKEYKFEFSDINK